MSAINRPPSSQFYWKDWLTDPDLRRMSFDQRGRYLDVLAKTYQTDHPGLCAEEDVRTWADYSSAQWKKHRDAFARLFTIKQDGTWIQESVVDARAAQRLRHERSVQGGRASAGRSRDSRGRLEPRADCGLESKLEDGLGTPSFASASAYSIKDQPNPGSRALATLQEPATPNSAANEFQGLQRTADVFPRIASPESQRSENGRALTDEFLDGQQHRFPRVDVRRIAAEMREEPATDPVRSPRALLVHRCKKASGQLRAGAAQEEKA